jgi:hypothetical protein
MLQLFADLLLPEPCPEELLPLDGGGRVAVNAHAGPNFRGEKHRSNASINLDEERPFRGNITPLTPSKIGGNNYLLPFSRFA